MSLSDLPEIESTCEDYPITPEIFEPDRRLLNWQTLLAERAKLHAMFVNNLGRSQAKLLINAAEDLREINEKKKMLENAHIWEVNRGRPIPAPALSKECPEDAGYYVTLSLAERGLPPKTEFVNVPDVIKEEKGAVFARNLYGFNQSKYLAKMMNQQCLLELYPHVPDANEIVVIGHKITEESPELNYEEWPEETGEEREEAPPTPKNRDYILSLNDLRLFSDEKETRVLTIFVETTPKKVIFNYVSVFNNGDTVLRFVFRKHAKRMVLGKPAQDNARGLFFYNKNVQVLQPGQKMDYSIGFQCGICGTYTHTLAMEFFPKIWEKNVQVLIQMQVNVYVNDFEAFCENVTEVLDERVRAAIIAETLEDCLLKIPPKQSEIITYSYDKKSIFEAVNGFYVNSEFFVKYAYNAQVVSELEEFYERVRLEEHAETWDYNIETLRAVVKRREWFEDAVRLEEGLDELFAKIEECKVKRDALEERVKAFWVETKAGKGKEGKGKGKAGKKEKKAKKEKKKDKGKGKKKAQAVVYTEAPREPLPNTLSDDLDAVVGKLRSSAAWKDEHARKIKLCVPLMCAYFDKIGAECGDLDLFFGIRRADHVEALNQNHVERFEAETTGCKLEYPRTMELLLDFRQKPAPPWCAAIPLEKHQARFAAFKAEKFPPVKKAVVEKPLQETPEEYPNPLFWDQTAEEEEMPAVLKDHYRNNLFMIISANLRQFVDDLSAVFELLQPENPVRLENLELIGRNNRAEIPEDAHEDRVFDLKKATSELFHFTREPPVCNCECICDLTPSILDLVRVYQTQSCKDALSSLSGEGEASAENVRVFLDAAAMTSPSIDLSAESSSDGGFCGVVKAESVECICRNKSKASFEYFDSVAGFDVVSSLSSDLDKRSCEKDN